MRVTQNGLNSLLVTWRYSSWPALVTGFHIWYYEEGEHNDSVIGGINDTNVTISRLTTGATYSISVVANTTTLPSYPSTIRFTLSMYITVYKSYNRNVSYCIILFLGNIFLGFSPSPTVAGDNVTFTCFIAVIDDTLEFLWEGPGVNNHEESVPGQLVLTEVSTSQAGVYSCIVSFAQKQLSTETTFIVQSEFK